VRESLKWLCALRKISFVDREFMHNRLAQRGGMKSELPQVATADEWRGAGRVVLECVCCSHTHSPNNDSSIANSDGHSAEADGYPDSTDAYTCPANTYLP